MRAKVVRHLEIPVGFGSQDLWEAENAQVLRMKKPSHHGRAPARRPSRALPHYKVSVILLDEARGSRHARNFRALHRRWRDSLCHLQRRALQVPMALRWRGIPLRWPRLVLRQCLRECRCNFPGRCQRARAQFSVLICGLTILAAAQTGARCDCGRYRKIVTRDDRRHPPARWRHAAWKFRSPVNNRSWHHGRINAFQREISARMLSMDGEPGFVRALSARSSEKTSLASAP